MTYLATLIQALRAIDMHQLAPLVALVAPVRSRGGTLWLCGNGGSFATAQHWACDLSKVNGVRALVLGAHTPTLTAHANDSSYADALANELDCYRRAGDALIALSCSGTSSNIARALAREIPTLLLTGLVNEATAPADHTIRVASHDYKIIEDCHVAIGHWLTKELAAL